MTRLRPDRHGHLTGLDRSLQRRKRGERRVDAHLPPRRYSRDAQQCGKIMHELHRLGVVLVHLPVTAHQDAALTFHHLFSSLAAAGRRPIDRSGD
jgi:hypothetical protein